MADTLNPLLGADFLGSHDLLINCKNKKLIDQTTNHVTPCKQVKNICQIVISDFLNHSHDINKLLIQFPSLTSDQPMNKLPVDNKIYHHIETDNTSPTFAKTRQLSPEKLKAAKEEFSALLKAGIIQRSKSPWSSALHMVPKGDTGKWRACGDYRVLNAKTKPDRYTVPHIHSVSSKLHNMKVFSKIDLFKAYHQIPVHPDDVEKTAIITPFGLFEYLFTPYGLRNAGSTFQRFMDHIFMDFNRCFIYIDDILVFSENEDQHLEDIKTVFKILDRYNLKISIDKCQFFKDNIDFLGCNISAEGLKPTKAKQFEIYNYPTPTNSKSLRRFIGMVGFYRRLIVDYANIVLPLTECIKIHPTCNELILTAKELKSFKDIKDILNNLTALPHPISDVTHYQLVTDASNFAVGGALHQMVNGEPRPVGFFSKKLSEAQRRTSTFDRELLGAYLNVLHFKPMIEGRRVVLLTDHKPLSAAFNKTTPMKSDKQQRYLSVITEFVDGINYIKGDQNVVADCLSREINAVSVDLYDLQSLAEMQESDEEIKLFPDLKSFKLTNGIIWCDVSTPYPRPFVPTNARKQMFESMHSIYHPGINGSLKLIKARYYWPNMDKNIRQWAKECQSCQQSKIHKHTKSAVMNFNLPSTRFEAVHIDLVGPLPPVRETVSDSYTSSKRYLLTCVDRATRWLEAVPISDMSAATVAVAFVNTWVSRFGVPLYVITDRGTQFESELFGELSTLIGFHRLRTTSFHAQANGMIERQHRTLKTAIMSRKQEWLQALPIVLLGMRNAVNESGYSPFTAVTGTSLFYPRPMIENKFPDDYSFNNEEIRTLANEMSKIDFENLSRGNLHSNPKSYIPVDLKTCTHVWVRIDRVRKSLEAPYTGPFKVIRRNSKFFIIENNSGKEQTISIDRLKPVYQMSKPEPETSDKIDSNNSAETNQSKSKDSTKTYTTRSGRKVKFRESEHVIYY